MKVGRKFVYFVCAVVGMLFGVGLFLFNGDSGMKSFDAVLEVGDSPSINNDVSLFDFGSIPKNGGIVKKFIDIGGGNSSQKIHIEASGSVIDFVSVSDNDFVLDREEFKTLTIRAVIPNGTEIGTYNGKINFYYSDYEM